MREAGDASPHRPRVLFISYDGMLEPLGQSQALPYLRGLASRGASIIVMSFEKRADWERRERVQSLQADLSARGIRWVPLRYHKRPVLLATSFDVLTGLFCAWRIVARDRVDIVHARSYVAATIGWLLKRWLGVRFLFATIGFWIDERVDAGFWSTTNPWYRVAKRLEQRFFEDADDIVTLTERARRIVQEWPGLRHPSVTAIPTCVDLARFSRASEPAAPGNAPVFIYTGSVGTYYLFEGVVEFFEQARRRFPQARLIILTRQTEAVRAILERMPLAPDAVTLTSADYAEIPGYLAKAHVGLAFYKPGFSRQGTSPTKVWEYLAMSLPVVVNQGVGDVEEIVGVQQAGLVLSEYSPAAYAQALETLERLWADPDLPGRCRRLAETHFSLERGIERYWTMYRRLCGQPAVLEDTRGNSRVPAVALEPVSP